MLKLERRGKSPDISVRSLEPEPVFNRLLWKALLIALGIHLGAVALFSVRPFIMGSTFIHQPVTVQSDQPNASRALAANNGEEQHLDVEPPPLNLFINAQLTDLAMPFSKDELAFEPIEKGLVSYRGAIDQEALRIHPIDLHISGELAERQLVKYDPLLDQIGVLDPDHMDPVYVKYQVQVDELDGKVFW